MTVHVPLQEPSVTPPLIAFVAEAPSTEELAGGRPLIGPSGRVFNSLLRTAQMDRAEYLITNVFDEKIPENELANWLVPMKTAMELGITDIPPVGKAGFLDLDHRWHLDRLAKELQKWKPTVVVPLGGTALWAFTGQTTITALRGGVLPATRIVPGVKLLPTFHPTAVIHQWKFFPVVVGDLLKAQREARRGPAIIYPERHLILEPSIDEIAQLVPRLLAAERLSVDIETGWGQITCIGFAPDSGTAICIPFLDKRVPSRNYWATDVEEARAWQLVKRLVESDTPKLGQNFGAYDAYWLLVKKGIRPRNLRDDTRLMHHALYPELPKDLAFMGASYTDQGPWKSWGKKQGKRDDL